MRRSVCVILNPAAGQTRRKTLDAAIRDQFDAADWKYTIRELTEAERVGAVTREVISGECDLVVAAGGDGTVCGVAEGLVGSGIPMGIIPTGTGNILAQDLGIPLSVRESLALLVGPHKLRAIDAMKSVNPDPAHDRYYFLNISIGMSSAVMVDTHSTQKRKLGMFAYVFTGLRKLAGLQATLFDLGIDDQRQRVRATDIVIANSGVVGLSQLRLDRHITVDDGEVSVCIIRARSAITYIQMLGSTLLNRKPTRGLWCIPAHTRVRIAADRPLPVQADGEAIGRQQVEIIVVPHAVSIIVPAMEIR